jgi:hypothetical protein
MKKYLLIIFLTISVIAKGQYYSIDTIPYNPDTYSGTIVPLGGNSYSPMIPIGFQFCFYGYKFDSVSIGSNGVVTFLNNYPMMDDCNWEIYEVTLPSPWSALSPRMGVMAPWQDLDPTLGGSITYSSIGTTPNRVFIVSFDSVPMDSCSKVFKGQVKLFETTNIIETHIAIKDTCFNWNHGRAAHGLEGPAISPSLAYGDYVADRNYPNCVWTAINDGIRFTPLVDVCSPLLVNEFGTGQNSFKLYPNPTTQFATLEFDNSKKENCILTLYNSIGQLVRTINDITSDKVIIERQSLTSGLYFFRLDNGKQTIAKGKLIIE